MITTKILKVMLWGREVGRLSIEPRRGLPYFEYKREWLETGMDISPLDASIKLPQNLRPIFGASEKIYQKLPPFLADSLPDAWGNELFEQWRRQQGIKLGEITPLDKLAFIGRRAMGALEFIPETSNFPVEENINLKALIELADRIYTQRENVHIAPDQSLTMQALMMVGTSAGGRQPKAIIAINRVTGEIRSGQVSELEGFDYCILKFGIPERSSAELEMAYYEMATKAGIKMMPCWLMEVDGNKHFVTKRFDRDGEKKLHIQTLAAIYPEADSYEHLLWVCRKMRLSELDCEEVFRRMVFNLLANNSDDHNKNFSFIMDDEGRWRLSPAYDLTYIFNTGGFLPETQHCIMIRGKHAGITLEDVRDLAAENGIRKSESIIREVAHAISEFRSIAEKYGVKEQWISAVESTIVHHLEGWGLGTGNSIMAFVDLAGHTIENVRIEMQYKGNYHLLASIDGMAVKHVIRKGTPEHDEITKTGLSNLTENRVKELVEQFLLSKY
ncbi:MAG: type II toxin-antitoxin system HipA family toxin [Bacteroidales bacterium]|nr:type II toxin-antitoxin system HipA family toxin [Bacteroidales bacterium]